MKFIYLLFLAALYLSCNQEKKTENNEPAPTKDSVTSNADMDNPYPPADKSPMDMIYFPVDYPKLKMAKSITSGPLVRIIYSRPQKQRRIIFGDLLKYGEPWRLGANESTEIEFFEPAIIQGKKINAGRFILYCIPQENNWTLILNSNTDTWGLSQDPQKDIIRFDVPLQKLNNSIEYFTMAFEKNDNGADLVMIWDNVLARLPITW